MAVHNHHTIEQPETPERHAAAKRSTLVSVLVNMVLGTVQIMIGIFSGSQGLIADGIHSLSDLMADFVVLVANQKSKKAADDDHQYGHLRYENAASLVLGMLLLAVGVGMLWSAVLKIQSPEHIPEVHVIALWVALGALVAKEGLFRYMLAIAQRIRSSMLIANAWHARSDAASSLVVALGICGNLMGYPLLDPIAALVVGLMVGRMGWKFAWDALHDLMDRAVSPEEANAIRTTLQETSGVLGLHDLRTRKVGDLIIVDVHLELDANLTVMEGHRIATDASDRVMRQHPVLNVMTHVDPVLNGVLIND
ncbi:cation diffusion facilitator family transporter [Solimicrobium silvestre]|uniref:CDF: cation diffusion facilitator family transporter n=1 Tax=Solimicrobium silvestre TaxID=2099400 RepID=A0A2S9GSG1_9BURK|nr:cation diffusion facilitator family transporter [Solimicrobium silvestre]PRC90662.1 CDF: cation diffusion facilitator family transporter [Solimicrobium silvestre]